LTVARQIELSNRPRIFDSNARIMKIIRFIKGRQCHGLREAFSSSTILRLIEINESQEKLISEPNKCIQKISS